MSTNVKIARAYSLLVVASIAGHGLSMLKEMLGASYFGVSRAMDAYYAALTIPNLINSLLLSPFTIIFVPIFIKHRLENRDTANRLVSTVSNFVLLALFAASLAIFAFSGQLIRCASPGLDAETAANAAKMLRIISLSMLFAGAVNILTGVLNALEQFFWPAVSGVIITLSTIFFILAFADKWGVFVVGWGLVAGVVLQCLFLIPFAAKHGYRHHGKIDLRHPEIKRSLNLTLIFLLSGGVAGLNGVVNRFMASWLPAGSIAALAYADKLVQVPLIIFSGAIAAAIYPFLSAQVSENKVEDIRNTVSMSLRMSGFIFIPLAVMMIVLARPAIQLVFQRGVFDAAAVDLTSKIFICYSFQLFSNYAVAILQRLLFAFQDLWAIFKLTAVGVVLNLVLNAAFISLLDPPACGIALSTSISSLISAVLYFMVLKRRVLNLDGPAVIRSLSRITVISVFAGLTAFLSYRGLGGVFHVTFAGHLAQLSAAFFAGAAVFILISAALKLEEFRKIYELARAKFAAHGARPEGGPLGGR